MDIEQFLAEKKPTRKRGKLFEVAGEIMQLHKAGYAVSDIQEWLKTKNIRVSNRAVYLKIKNLKQKQGPSATHTPEKEDEEKRLKSEPNPSLNRFKSSGIKSREEREAFASQFISDQPISPQTKRLIAKKEQS